MGSSSRLSCVTIFGTTSGERGDVDITCVNESQICEGYNPKEFFNMDETGLSSKTLPRKPTMSKVCIDLANAFINSFGFLT